MMVIHSGGSARCDVQDSPARGSAFWLKAVEVDVVMIRDPLR